ncbi:MAG: universal stress protein [Nitrosospira sp.]
MYKRITVVIGDDEISPKALKEALHLASAYGARICLVHAVAEPGDDEDERSGPGEQPVWSCLRRRNPPLLKR